MIKFTNRQAGYSRAMSVCAIAFCCLALVGCKSETTTDNQIKNVYAVQPTVSGDTYCKHFSGMVQEASDVDLGFKTPGQIQKILVKEGDYVTKGQLLAKLDESDYQLGVRAAQIQYDQLKEEVDRMEELYKRKAVSENDYAKATAGLEQLQIQLKSYQNKVAWTSLYAPCNGYVNKVNFSEHEMVDAGHPIVDLLNVSNMQVNFNLHLNDLQLRSRFDHITISSKNCEEQPMELRTVSPKADGNQLYLVTLAFKNAESKEFVVGENVDVNVYIRTENGTASVCVPSSALWEDQGKTYVWVIDDQNTVHKKAIQTGLIDSKGQVVVRQGLSGQEHIVTGGVRSLQEGDKVQIIQEPAASNVGGIL